MSKEVKQIVYDTVFLRSLEGFTVKKVADEHGDTVIEMENIQAGATIKLYVNRVLYGSEMIKMQEIRMQVSQKVKKQFSTSQKDLENIGIHITEEQYSDLCEINLFMKGMPDIPVYNILLVLKTLGLIPTKVPDQESNKERNSNLDELIKSGFERKFGKIEK